MKSIDNVYSKFCTCDKCDQVDFQENLLILPILNLKSMYCRMSCQTILPQVIELVLVAYAKPKCVLYQHTYTVVPTYRLPIRGL